MKSYGSSVRDWSVKMIHRSDGRYWPYLLHRGVPLPLPSLWIQSCGSAGSENTADSYLRDVMLLYKTGEKEGFCIEGRLRALEGFSQKELRAITRSLTQTASGKSAAKATCDRRAQSVRSFILFAFEYYKQQLQLSWLEQAQVDRNAARQCKALVRLLRIAANTGSGSRAASRLSPDEVALVEAVIHPESDLNPFASYEIRFRNYCIFHVLWEAAPRRGELVLLEIGDVSLGGSPTLLIKRPTVAAQSKKRDGASLKTLGRVVPISNSLASLLEEYREYWRTKQVIPGRPSLAFFLSARDGRRLSAYSVNKIIESVSQVESIAAIGKRLHPHGMRSTALNSMRQKIQSTGLASDVQLTDALTYVGGWKQNSPMVAHYTRESISERLAKVLREPCGRKKHE